MATVLKPPTLTELPYWSGCRPKLTRWGGVVVAQHGRFAHGHDGQEWPVPEARRSMHLSTRARFPQPYSCIPAHFRHG